MLAEWLGAGIEVVPAVDILGAGAVRLNRGDYDDVVERAGDPVELARRWAAEGATRIHVVDLDGARSGAVRPELIRELVAAAAPAAVQASGGIRSLADAQALLDAGADRVVVGTAAFPDPAPWAEALGERLVVALDVRDGRIRTPAGRREAGLELAEAVERCLAAGVIRVLCTAIDRDGTLAGPDLELVESVAASGLRVLAAGGVRSPRRRRGRSRGAGAEAAVVGRALLTRACLCRAGRRRGAALRGRVAIWLCESQPACPARQLKVGDSVDVTSTKIGCFTKISADRKAIICELATTTGLIKGTYGVGIAANGDTVVSKVNKKGDAIALWAARGKASARAHEATYYEPPHRRDTFGFEIPGGDIGCDILDITTGTAQFTGRRVVCFHSIKGKPVANSYAVVLSNKFAGAFRFTAKSQIGPNAIVEIQPK